jgi:hypothetical protein
MIYSIISAEVVKNSLFKNKLLTLKRLLKHCCEIRTLFYSFYCFDELSIETILPRYLFI